MDKKPLWPKPIPIIGGTGEFESGKSLFGLTIDPGPRTLVYDVEKSTAAYTDLGFERIDVLDEMQKKFPGGYKPVDLFIWWREHVRSIPAGKYTVIVVDPVTDIERGLTDYVNANPQQFGHTAGQYAKMSGIMWGDVKDFEKAILGDIASRCETFYYTAHLGREFDGNEATKKKKVKGKQTLSELATLFLWFDRSPNAQGVKPDKPSAYVRKCRLLHNKIDPATGELEMYKVLPPRMPVATPKAIRDYFANPAGGRAAAEDEAAQDESLTEDEKLVIRMRTAEAEAAAALAKGSAAATVAGQATAAPAATSETKVATVDAFERLKALIGEADSLDKLRAVAATLKDETPKLNATQQQVIKKHFAERKDELSKSSPATPAPGAGGSSSEVPAAAS